MTSKRSSGSSARSSLSSADRAEDRGRVTMPTEAGRAATVEFDHVSKVYGPAPSKGPGGDGRVATPGAVNDLSLAVPAGRICVLVGPSGCGKTTSLKMVNRLIEPTSGRILLDGVDIATRDRDRAAPRHRLRDPAGRPVPAPDDRRERGRRAAPAGLAGGAGQRARAEELLALVGPGSGAVPRPLPERSSPAASASGSAWPGPWPPIRR